MEQILVILFLSSLLFGELTHFQLGPVSLPRVHDIMLLILIGFSLVKHGKIFVGFVRENRIFQGILFFIIACSVSLLVNIPQFTNAELIISSLYLFRWTAYSFLVFVSMRTLRQTVWLYGLYIVGVVFALLGFMQVLLYPYLRNLAYLGWDPHRYRLFSTLLDPNFAGIILVITFFLGLSLWQWAKIRPQIFLISQTLLLSAIYLTYSRSSLLAFIAGLLIWFVLQKKSVRLVRIGILGVSLFLLAVVVIPRPGGNTLRLDRRDSTIARIGNWQESIALFRRSPVFGLGFDTLRFVRRTSDAFDPSSHAAGGVDNSFLFVFVTTGIVGAGFYGYLLYQMIRMGTKLVNIQKMRWFGAGYLSLIFAIFTHSLFTNSQFYPWVMVYIFILTGVGIGFREKSYFR